MTDRAELERRVVEAARDWAIGAHGLAHCLGSSSKRLLDAILALDAAPPDPPTGEALSEHAVEWIEKRIAEHAADDHEILQGFEKRLAALEHEIHAGMEREGNALVGLRKRVTDLEQPPVAPPLAPGGEPMLEGRWNDARKRACLLSDGETFIGISREEFLREARSIASSARRRALEEAYSLVRRITEESPAKWNHWRDFHADLHAAIDALLAREGKETQ